MKKYILTKQRLYSLCAIAFGLLVIYIASTAAEQEDASFGVFLVVMGVYGLISRKRIGGEDETN